MGKNKIKAVIFDIGGVLTRVTISRHYKPMCKALRVDFKKFLDIRKKYVGKARLGEISTREYISSISRDLGIKYGDLLREWMKYKLQDFKIRRDVEKTIKKLRKSYIVGSLTNIIELHDKVREANKIHQLFDFSIRSFKVRMGKPKEGMYLLLLKKLRSIDKSIKPEEIIFIDDHESCIKGARKLGIRGILFKDNKQILEALKKQGITL